MTLSWFAQVPPGLEDTLAGELAKMGFRPTASVGGVELRGPVELGWKVALCNRVASGILLRVGVARGANAAAVTRSVKAMRWAEWIHPAQEVEVRAAGRGGSLRTAQVEGAVRRGIAESLRGPRLPGRRPPRRPAVVRVRGLGDGWEVSIDACGDLLHRRGWRKETAKAPLRENLAAAVLELAGWGPGTPLVDPMCGSGTFPIEAGTWALGIRPGARRGFAFEDWPSHDARAWAALQARESSTRESAQAAAPILGFDRDPGAIRAARSNLQRSGAGSVVRLAQGELGDLQPPAERGLLVANPPWGLRVAGEAAGGVWALLGSVARARFSGWTVALVGPSVDHLRATRLPLKEVARFPSGGQRLMVWIGAVP